MQCKSEIYTQGLTYRSALISLSSSLCGFFFPFSPFFLFFGGQVKKKEQSFQQPENQSPFRDSGAGEGCYFLLCLTKGEAQRGLNTVGFGQFPHQHYNLRGSWCGPPATHPGDTAGLLPSAELGTKADFKSGKCVFKGRTKLKRARGLWFEHCVFLEWGR